MKQSPTICRSRRFAKTFLDRCVAWRARARELRRPYAMRFSVISSMPNALHHIEYMTFTVDSN